MIFSELYSAYYNAVAAILKDASTSPLTKSSLREIANKHAFGESFIKIEEALTVGDWPLLNANGTSVLQKTPDMPLTLLQKRWLKSISLDPRIKLFGDCLPNFPDVEPLFTPQDFCIYDAYGDGDDYSDPGYVERFRLILQCIREKRAMFYAVTNRNGRSNRFCAMPEYLEYSEKDDKFRLITSGTRYGTVINLGRISACSVKEGEWQQRYPAKQSVADSQLVLEVINRRNALERVLMHFAHFEKQAEKLGDNKYRVTVKYEKNDETEMVIRVLSFGPLVTAVAPQNLVKLIKKRLIDQKSCEF